MTVLYTLLRLLGWGVGLVRDVLTTELTTDCEGRGQAA